MPQSQQEVLGNKETTDKALYTALYYPEKFRIELYRYETLVYVYVDVDEVFAINLRNFFDIPEDRFKIIFEEDEIFE